MGVLKPTTFFRNPQINIHKNVSMTPKGPATFRAALIAIVLVASYAVFARASARFSFKPFGETGKVI